MHFSALFVTALAANAMAACTKGHSEGRHRHSHTQAAEKATYTTITYGEPAYHKPVYVPHTTTLYKVPKATKAASYTNVASSGGSPYTGLPSDEAGALEAHNKARSEVGTKALTWDDKLAAGAQEWANHLASIGSLVHSGAEGLGENIYMQSGSDKPLTNAVNSFLEEKSSYTPGEAISGTNYQTFGHYTQCIWGKTKTVGMASAKAYDGSVWVVARYHEAGNFINETPY